MPRHKLTEEDQREIAERLRKHHKDNKEYACHNEYLKETRVELKCKNAKQKSLIKSIKENEITVAAGPAGTGKTYLACAQALKLLKGDARYEKIMLVKSVTGLKDEDIGFLPGDANEKMHPYMMSYMANFYKLIGEKKTNELFHAGQIVYTPLLYIRGANHDNAIILIDETQNISISNVRTIMTRLGSDAKMVFLGDEKQIDLRRKNLSSLPYLIKNFADMNEIGTIRFNKSDIVRNSLIEKIEDVFDNNPYE
jgi:phosphate starvation-inducible PhoH-like protein